MNRNAHFDFLKGIAILMVIVIHGLSAFIPGSYDFSFSSVLYRTIQQLMRPAVPIFVGVSGYLLASSQLYHPLTFVQFIKRRLFALLPLYLIWTALIPLIYWLNPHWQNNLNGYQWWQIVLFGRADYHLYFVPMIIILYALFPALFYLLKSRTKLILALALGLQLVTYLVIALNPAWPFFHYDQQYYIFPGSWIFYFVLGMYLKMFPVSVKAQKIFLAIAISGALLTILEGELMIRNGFNLLPATQTTRFPVVLFAGGLLISALNMVEVTNKNKWYWLVVKMGQWSYLIFMIHTIFLRILQEIFSSSSSWLLLQAPIVAYLVGVGLSLRLARRRA